MKKQTFKANWLLPLLILILLLPAACSRETPITEPPQPEQPQITNTPTEETPLAEPQATPEKESIAEEVTEDQQPVDPWKIISEQGHWVLIGYGEALNPTVVEPGTYVNISFSATDDQVIGSGGCNNYSTSYNANNNGNLMINTPIGVTKMACETGMAQEAMFLSALENVTGYSINENGHLLLDYDSGTAYDEKLVFVPEAYLIDTVWVMTAYGDPENPTHTRPDVATTMILSANGTLEGNTGCNNYAGSYSLQGNQITFGLPTINLMACEKGGQQEQAFVSLLTNAQSYRLGVESLEITTADGAQELHFSAQQYSLENVLWQLDSINRQSLPEDLSANILFTPANSPAVQNNTNSVSGSTGCNTFLGTYSRVGDTLAIDSLDVTQMICDEPTMQIEQTLLAGLEDSQSYQITYDQLIVNTASGSLRFYADRLPLEGPQWILTGRGPIDNPQPPTADTLFTASFSRPFGMPSGIKSGTTGCNEYTASYYATFDTLKVNLPQTSQNTCSQAQAQAEQSYFLGLNAAWDYRILGNELYIYYDNQVLIFVGNYQPVEAAPPPGPLVLLDGTQWWLTAIDNDTVIPESEVTILFEINSDGRTGTINGSGGCNTYNADIADVFTLWSIRATEQTCNTPNGVMDQEDAYLSTLQDATSILIEGNNLRIKTDQNTLYFTKKVPESAQPSPTPEGPAAVIIAPSNEFVGQLIVFDGSLSASNAEIIAYNWWFSDETTEQGVTVERTYNTIGRYDAILTITDAKGQTAEASVKVRIHPYLVGSNWISDDGTITLSFSNGTLSGNAGCNDYSAAYSASTTNIGDTNEMSIDPIMVTGQTCDSGVMEKERIYLDSLQTTSNYLINVDTLTLTTVAGPLTFYLTAASP